MSLRISRFAAIAATVGLVTGCIVGPDYERPTLALPNAHPIIIDGATGASLANIAWFELFDDPALTALIDRALADNLDLRAAAGGLLEARERARLAGAGPLPNVAGALSSSPAPGQGSNDTSYSLGIALAWELDFFGKLRRAAEAAVADALASEESARAVTVSLVASVSSTYLTIRELDRRIAIVDRTIASQADSLSLVQELKGAGVTSAAEEQQALSLVASTRATLPILKQNRIAAENALAVLLGLAPQMLVAQDDAYSSPSLPDFSVDLPTDLLSNRPDLRAAEERLRAATARVGVAIANRFPFPTIGLTALGARFSPSLSDLADDGVSAFSWGPTGSIPLLDFGRTDANVGIADAQLLQASDGYRLSVLNALREVNDALAALRAAREVIEHNRTRVTAASEVLRLQQLRFKQGVVAYLEVLDAERQLLAARLDLVGAEFSRVQQFVTLYRSLGGGADDERLQSVLDTLK